MKVEERKIKLKLKLIPIEIEVEEKRTTLKSAALSIDHRINFLRRPDSCFKMKFSKPSNFRSCFFSVSVAGCCDSTRLSHKWFNSSFNYISDFFLHRLWAWKAEISRKKLGVEMVGERRQKVGSTLWRIRPRFLIPQKLLSRDSSFS